MPNNPDSVKDIKPLLVCPSVAAGLLGISLRTLWRLVATSELSAIRIGRCRRFERAEIDRFIASRREQKGGVQ